MTTIADFKAAERALAEQFTAFEEMKQNPELRKALELDAALEAFCAEHKTTRQALYDLLALDIEPDQKSAKKTAASSAKPAAPKGQQPRKVQVYKIRWYRNPHTNEELEVRGNRDARFNAWNIEYGRDVVASWKFREEDLPPKAPK